MQENKQEKSLIKQNILLYLEKKRVTPYEFYKVSGVTRGVLAQNNGISEDNIARFLAYAPDVNPTWLLTNRGEMLLDKQEISNVQEINEQNFPVAHQTDNPNEGIPLIPIKAMAGALTCEQTVLEYECERYVIPMFKGADFLIPVKGSSMYPKYSSGDIVACQRVAMSDLFFQWNKVYAIDTNQGALIKRIKPGSDKNHVLIVSDNEKYDSFELPVSAIHAVALVIGVIRLE
jgi:phage repressor protein C with HTH and peptisase S24 domain